MTVLLRTTSTQQRTFDIIVIIDGYDLIYGFKYRGKITWKKRTFGITQNGRSTEFQRREVKLP